MSLFFLSGMNKHMPRGPSGPSGILTCIQNFLSSLHLGAKVGVAQSPLRGWQVSGSAPTAPCFVGVGIVILMETEQGGGA